MDTIDCSRSQLDARGLGQSGKLLARYTPGTRGRRAAEVMAAIDQLSHGALRCCAGLTLALVLQLKCEILQVQCRLSVPHHHSSGHNPVELAP